MRPSPHAVETLPLSRKNIRLLRGLTTKKHREEQRKFIIEGIRLVTEAVESNFELLETYYTKEVSDHPGGRELLSLIRERSPLMREVSPHELQAMSDTVTTQGVVAVLRQRQFVIDDILRRDAGTSIVVAFDAVSDPGNAGTMIRTCDWFGVDGILLGAHSVELYNPKLLRSTMGGVFHLPIVEDVDLPVAVTQARAFGYTVYVTDAKGDTHFDRVTFSTKSLIVFGNEAWGVSDQVKSLADSRVLIRRYGAAESLNVSVACGVVLSGLHRLYDE